MTYRIWTPEEAQAFAAFRGEGLSYEEVAAAMARSGFEPRSKDQYMDAVRRAPLVRRALLGEPPETGLLVKRQERDGSTLTALANRPLSEEEILDLWALDPNCWTITRLVCNTWGRQWQTKAWLSRQDANLLARGVWDALIEEVRREAVPPGVRATGSAPQRMLEMDIFDAHFGKLCWAPESGANYDLTIAMDDYLSAGREILEAAGRVERVLIPVGNDLLHADDSTNRTRRGSNLLDVDGRWQKAFLVAVRAVRKLVSMALGYADAVDLVIVPGNHDVERSYYVGEVLAAAYEGDGRVTVDNRPLVRKAVRYHKVMIAFQHGERGMKDLAGLMLATWPEMAGMTTYREWHVGHLHHESVTERHGVRVRVLPSISAADAWHVGEGYVGSHRQGVGFVWAPTHLSQVLYSTPLTVG